MSALAQALLDGGLIELGLFDAVERLVPLRWRFDLLPAYPDVLDLLAEQVAIQIAQHSVDRLVCTPDALALATAVALRTRIPVIYSRGRGEAPLYDLVGAYDVGHQAALLTLALDAPDVQRVIEGGLKTGFVTRTIVAVTDQGISWPDPAQSISVLLPLADLTAVIHPLLPAGQAAALRAWQHTTSDG